MTAPDLVARLRDEAANWDAVVPVAASSGARSVVECRCDLFAQAADEIERLQAENEQLRRQLASVTGALP